MRRCRLQKGALDATRAEHARINEAIAGRDPVLARIVAAAHAANSEHWLQADLSQIEAAGKATELPHRGLTVPAMPLSAVNRSPLCGFSGRSGSVQFQC